MNILRQQMKELKLDGMAQAFDQLQDSGDSDLNPDKKEIVAPAPPPVIRYARMTAEGGCPTTLSYNTPVVLPATDHKPGRRGTTLRGYAFLLAREQDISLRAPHLRHPAGIPADPRQGVHSGAPARPG